MIWYMYRIWGMYNRMAAAPTKCFNVNLVLRDIVHVANELVDEPAGLSQSKLPRVVFA